MADQIPLPGEENLLDQFTDFGFKMADQRPLPGEENLLDQFTDFGFKMPGQSPPPGEDDLLSKIVAEHNPEYVSDSTTDSSEYSDSTSDSESDLKSVLGKPEDLDSTQLKETVSELKSRIQRLGSDVLAPKDASLTSYFSDDEPDLDEVYDEEWTKAFVTPSNQSMRLLQETCWRFVDSVRRCLAHDSKLRAMGMPGVDIRRLRRIVQQLNLLEIDLDDFTFSYTPVLQELSVIRNLSTLIHQLTGRGVKSVFVFQVQDEINADRVSSLYEGFASFRREDLKTLESHSLQIDLHLTNWELLTPYFRSYCLETDKLADTEDKWFDVKMSKAELMVWNKSMRELVGAAYKMLPLCSATLRNLEEAIRMYRNCRKSVKFNLSSFMRLDINKLFDKESLTS